MAYKIFCNELGRLISIEEVWELKYGKNRINHELTFKCPDTECDARFILSNCAEYLDASEIRFRLYFRSKHRCECQFAELQRSEKNARIRAKYRPFITNKNKYKY